MTEWYYHVSGKGREGPFSTEQMQRLFDAGEVSRDTMVWQTDFETWQAFEDCFQTSSTSSVAQTSVIDDTVTLEQPATAQSSLSDLELALDDLIDRNVETSQADTESAVDTTTTSSHARDYATQESDILSDIEASLSTPTPPASAALDTPDDVTAYLDGDEHARQVMPAAVTSTPEPQPAPIEDIVSGHAPISTAPASTPAIPVQATAADNAIPVASPQSAESRVPMAPEKKSLPATNSSTRTYTLVAVVIIIIVAIVLGIILFR